MVELGKYFYDITEKRKYDLNIIPAREWSEKKRFGFRGDESLFKYEKEKYYNKINQKIKKLWVELTLLQKVKEILERVEETDFTE